MHTSRALFVAIIGLILASCTRQTFETNPRHVVQTPAYWNLPAEAGSPKPLRSGPIPAEVEDYMLQENRKDGIALISKGYPASTSFAADVSAAIATMPQLARSLLEKRVVGIFYARDLGSSAYAKYILDAAGKPVAVFIVLDLDVLNHSANDWMTYKENLPFSRSETSRMVGIIEHEKENTRANAIQFLLLHELGHVAQINPVAGGKYYRLFDDDWRRNDAGKYDSAYEAAFPQRRNITYYISAGKTDMPTAKSAYQSLRLTPYTTLYGATNAYDDFAETYAIYMHVVLMGKPYTLRIYEANKLVDAYNIQDEMPRIKPRLKRMAALLAEKH